jgi:hypothetical protein
MVNSKQMEIASKILKITEQEILEYSFEIENTDAIYISVPVKGGDSLIISADGEVLYANSSVSFDEHVSEFLAGRRTPLEAFE